MLRCLRRSGMWRGWPGVSPSTVSRALSMPAMVNAATRARVAGRGRAARLPAQPGRPRPDHRPHRQHRPDRARPGQPVLPRASSRACRPAPAESDVAVFVADTDEDAAAEVGLVRALAKQVDGIVLCSPRDERRRPAAIAQDTNVVLVNRAGRAASPAITYRQRRRHAPGRRPPGRARPPPDRLGRWPAARPGRPQHRGLGLRNAVDDARRRRWSRSATSRRTFDGGIAAADQVVATGATAVIAYNDLVALGLLARFARPRHLGARRPQRGRLRRHRRCPGWSSPALTTVAAAQGGGRPDRASSCCCTCSTTRTARPSHAAAPCTASSSSATPPAPRRLLTAVINPVSTPGPP